MANTNLKWNVRFNWNKSTGQIITNKGFGKDLNKYVAQCILAKSEPYTPYSWTDYPYHLMVMRRIVATKDMAKITYTKKYAAEQYNNPHDHSNSPHPLATDHWLEYGYDMNKPVIQKLVRNKRKEIARANHHK